MTVWPTHRNHEILGESLARRGLGVFVAGLASLEAEEIRMKVAAMKKEAENIARAPGERYGPEKAARILLAIM